MLLDLTRVSDLLLDLGMAAVGFLLLVLGRLLLARVLPRLSARSELELLQELARMAVEAAEVMGHTQGWTGTDKLRLATRVVNEALGRLGVEVSEEEVRAAIEQAVLDLKKYRGELKREE